MRFAGFALTLVAMVVTVSGAEAQQRAFVKCPRFVVDQASGTFRQLSGPGTRCSNNAAALRRLGYIQAGSTGDPANAANPELDTERLFQGTGAVRITKAFRVTSNARIASITVSGCTNRFHPTFDVGSFAVTDQRGNGVSGPDEVHPDALASATIFTPGVYGVSFEVSPTAVGTCSFTIRVQ